MRSGVAILTNETERRDLVHYTKSHLANRTMRCAVAPIFCDVSTLHRAVREHQRAKSRASSQLAFSVLTKSTVQQSILLVLLAASTGARAHSPSLPSTVATQITAGGSRTCALTTAVSAQAAGVHVQGARRPSNLAGRRSASSSALRRFAPHIHARFSRVSSYYAR